MALSIFFAFIFSAIGLYGAYFIFSPLLERIPKLNEYTKQIIRIVLAFLVFLLFLFSLMHIISSYSDEKSSLSYDKGYAEGSATVGNTVPVKTYDEGYDEGYLLGFEDGYDKAYEQMKELISLNSRGEVSENSGESALSSVSVPETSEPITNQPAVSTSDSTQSVPPSSTAETASSSEPAATLGTVYYTESGEVYHSTKDCSYLKKAKNILSGDISSISDRRACSRCVK